MSIQPPRVSVIIPTFNRPDLLTRAVQSVLRQTESSIEIVVANDSGQPVEALLLELDQGQGKITSLRAAQNAGRSATRNMALKVAKGKYIGYLDDDDFFYPEHLKTLCDFLDTANEKVVYSDALNAMQRWEKDRWVTMETRLEYSHDFDYDHIFVHNFVPTLCFVHARECLDKTGLFDESLATQEDWDLWLRLSLHFKMNHIPKVTAEYTTRLGTGQQSRTDAQADFYPTLCRVHAKYAHLVKKSEIETKQRDYRKATSVAYERVQGQIVTHFMKRIMDLVDAQDFRGALEIYTNERQSMQFDHYKGELDRMDGLMIKVKQIVKQ